MKVFYFRAGQKREYEADSLDAAIERMYSLKRRFGNGFYGCSWFFTVVNGERVWLQ